MSERSSIDVIIVNWNSGNQLCECLRSILKYSSEKIKRILVVDNNSYDSSTLMIGDLLDARIKLIKNEENVGFARACNQGARLGNSEFILFLNPDIRITEESIEKTLNFIDDDNHNRIGIVGIQLIDDGGKIAASCSRFPTPSLILSQIIGLNKLCHRIFLTTTMFEWNHKESRVVDQVMGAFFLVRRDLFNKLNGFDERFFLYLEEVDFAFRAKTLGYLSYYYSRAQAYHRGCGTTSQIRDLRLFYLLRSRLQYSIKHFGKLSVLVLLLASVLIEPVSRFIFTALKDSIKECGKVIKGHDMYIKSISAIFRLSGNRR